MHIGFMKSHSLKFLNFLFFPSGTIPIPLQLWFEGPVKKLAAGGPDQTLWKPEERRQRHQRPQMVFHNRLDRNLRAKGKPCFISIITIMSPSHVNCLLIHACLFFGRFAHNIFQVLCHVVFLESMAFIWCFVFISFVAIIAFWNCVQKV